MLHGRVRAGERSAFVGMIQTACVEVVEVGRQRNPDNFRMFHGYSRTPPGGEAKFASAGDLASRDEGVEW